VKPQKDSPMIAKDILKLAGFPTDYIVLDFETYFDSEYSLTNMSSWEYIADDRFEVLGLGLWDSRDSNCGYTAQSHVDKYIYSEDWDRVTVVVQNAQFDPLILKLIYGIAPKYIIDIKHLAAHFDSRMSHRLKDLAKRFGLQDKGNTADFKGLHYRDMTDEQHRAIAEYCLNDIDLEAKLFEILLPKLTNPAVELAIANHTTGMYLTPRMSFDFALAEELEVKMQGYIDEACADVGMTKDEVSGDLSFTAALKAALEVVGETVPVKPHKRPGKKMSELLGQEGVGPALAKTDEVCQELEVHSNDRVRALMAARKAIGSWPTHIKRIRKMVAIVKAAKGRLPAPLNYYGAHTGRFSGGGGVNLQNMGAKGRSGSGNHPVLGQMREMICSGEGASFLIADSAQIEARVLAWLAGATDLVEGFAKDRDVYSEFAAKLFGAVVRKPSPMDPPPIKKLLSLRRGFGKDTILGAGYGMGALKFFQNCRKNADLRPLFDSGQYDFEFVNGLIKLYRHTYSTIPAFWKTLEKMFRMVTRFPHERYQYNAPGLPVSAALLTLWNDRGTVNVQLPSGRVLYYPHASISKSKNEYLNGQLEYHHGELWGGTLTENVVQAIARDLLVYWILECEKAGLPVALHVHDEIVTVCNDYFVDDCLEVVLNIMETGPSWSAGIPLSAEGCISKVYKK
jgi:DNA polymerase